MMMKDINVGIFLSDCNGQISKILNFQDLINYAKSIPGVVHATQNKEFVFEEGIQLIKDAVETKGLNRVVVSAGDAITAMIRIRKALQEAELNPYFVDVINLREHCALPHQNDAKGATEKAKAMLLAAVEKVKLQEPIEPLEFAVNQSALIIGGGIGGIQAAIDLAELGFQVNLVEKEPVLGGIAAKVGRFFPTDDCSLCIQAPSSDLKGITHTSRKCLYRSGFSELPNLNILTNSRVVGVEGGPGNYRVSVERGEASGPSIVQFYPPIYSPEEAKASTKRETVTLDTGAIIVATGFELFDSSIIKEYNYGVYPDIVTQLELAEMLNPFGLTGGTLLRPSDQSAAKSVVMVQCVGSRDQRHNAYCSSICCMIALKHALMIKERYPDTDVKICYIDIRSWGKGHEENYYEKAREAGVKFIKGRPTEIIRNPSTSKLVVDVEDALLREFLGLEADLVVLSTAFVPSTGTKELADLIGLDLSEDGFFKEYNAKLRPTETKLRGVYLCGGATFPKDAPTTSLHAHSAALKAAKFMTAEKLMKDEATAVINSDLCGDCEFCPAVCPFGAIILKEEGDHVVAEVEDLNCEACGICVGTCPKNAIELKGLTEDQITAQMKALMTNNGDKPTVLAFSCAECGFTAVDTAGMYAAEYPSNVRVLKVPCTGILKINHILEAFTAGADAVMVVGCKTDGCHYEEGSVKAERRVQFAKKLLGLYGIAPERLEMFHNVSIEGKDFAEEARCMTKRAQTLGSIERTIV